MRDVIKDGPTQWDKYVNVYRVNPLSGHDSYYTSGYVISEDDKFFELAVAMYQGSTIFNTNDFYYEIDGEDPNEDRQL